MVLPPPESTLFPYTTLFRSHGILKTIEKELSANHVENVSVKILYVSDEKIIFFVDGIINNNIDENNIIMALRKYPDIKRISYTSLGK